MAGNLWTRASPRNAQKETPAGGGPAGVHREGSEGRSYPSRVNSKPDAAAGDEFNVGAQDAEIGQLAVGQLREFTDRSPVATPCIEAFGDRLDGHSSILISLEFRAQRRRN